MPQWEGGSERANVSCFERLTVLLGASEGKCTELRHLQDTHSKKHFYSCTWGGPDRKRKLVLVAGSAPTGLLVLHPRGAPNGLWTQ
jgi:hypothetical protein